MGIIEGIRRVIRGTLLPSANKLPPFINVDKLPLNQTQQVRLTPGQSVRIVGADNWYELSIMTDGQVLVKRQYEDGRNRGSLSVLTRGFNVFNSSSVRVCLEDKGNQGYLFTVGALPLVEWTNSTPYILPEGEKVRMQIGGDAYLLEREYDCFAPNKYILTKVLENGRAERCSVNTQERQKVLAGTVNIQLVTRSEGVGVYLSLVAKIDEEPTIVGPINTESTLIMGNMPLPRAVLEPRNDKGIEFSRVMLAALHQEVRAGNMSFGLGGKPWLYFKIDPSSMSLLHTGEINDYNIEVQYDVNANSMIDYRTLKPTQHLYQCLARAVTAYNNRERI